MALLWSLAGIVVCVHPANSSRNKKMPKNGFIVVPPFLYPIILDGLEKSKYLY